MECSSTEENPNQSAKLGAAPLTPTEEEDRFVDVFDDVVDEIPTEKWRRFAHNRRGLKLDDAVINKLVKDFDQITQNEKYRLLEEWQSQNADATPETLKAILKTFLEKYTTKTTSCTSTGQGRKITTFITRNENVTALSYAKDNANVNTNFVDTEVKIKTGGKKFHGDPATEAKAKLAAEQNVSSLNYGKDGATVNANYVDSNVILTSGGSKKPNPEPTPKAKTEQAADDQGYTSTLNVQTVNAEKFIGYSETNFFSN